MRPKYDLNRPAPVYTYRKTEIDDDFSEVDDDFWPSVIFNLFLIG